MSSRAFPLLVLMVSVVVAAAACSGGGQPIDVGEGDDDDVVYDNTFGNGAFDAMAKENCGKISGTCHSSAGQASCGDLQLPDSVGTITSGAAFAEIDAQVPPVIVFGTGGDPTTSTLLMKGAGLPGHVGGALWAPGDATYDAVLAWLNAGAQNN